MKRIAAGLIAAILLLSAIRVDAQWQPYLSRDYAWEQYYQSHHEQRLYAEEQARIAREQAELKHRNKLREHYDYSYHHDYPPGWTH